MTCFPAPTLVAMRAEATRIAPLRSLLSDGICASVSHSSQNPVSDHERGEACDLTHDPLHGFDAHARVDRIRLRKDPRVKYIISQGRIASHDRDFIWRPYDGNNPHDRHAHVSIFRASRDDMRPWFVASPVLVPPGQGEELPMYTSIQVVCDLGVDGYPPQTVWITDGLLGRMPAGKFPDEVRRRIDSGRLDPNIYKWLPGELKRIPIIDP